MNSQTLTHLYPSIEPYNTHYLAVGQSHVLHVEECGNPGGLPILFLHGGPGGYCKPHHRCYFNPKIYRIILFDQRGTGRSIPLGSVIDNTTDLLVEDMERIRKKLKIEKWAILGGSWGTTLGLTYAQKYPDRVLGLILRSTFLARGSDIRWFHEAGGVSRFFPEQWQLFMQFVPDKYIDNPLHFYNKCFSNRDTNIAHAAALAWASWSGCVVSNGEFVVPETESAELLNSARIECHYAVNHFFLEEYQLLRDVDRLSGIPGIIIHGQGDFACPLENSYTLQQAWSEADLKILPKSGHLASDPDMIAALVEATDDMANYLLADTK